MKSTGIVRKVDELGRIVLPMKLRKSLDIGYRAPMEMYVEGERIILKRYKPSCAFCGETENTAEFRGKLVCSLCKQELGFRAPEKV